MRFMRMTVASIACTVAVLALPASAQKQEFAFSIGYSELSLDDAAGELDGRGGFRFEPRFSWEPFEELSQLRFGVGLGLSYYYHDVGAGEIISPPFGFDVESYEDAGLFTPEFQISWRQPMSEKWWLEGGVGIGPAFGFYSAGDVIFDELFDEDVSEDDIGFGVRPFVRAAYRGDGWSWGLEGSYQWTDLDFGTPFGDDVTEWYIGLFFGFGK